jgi:hypothetical protein
MTDTVVYVPTTYTPMAIWAWSYAISRKSGLQCGITNDGVYKIKRPTSYSPGGKAPYRFQISATTNFSGVPFETGQDSAVFSGLNENSTYYVRVTDACDNFITVNFQTPATVANIPISYPELSVSANYNTKCSGLSSLNISFRDSISGAPYALSELTRQHGFWGNKNVPYFRLQVKNASSNKVYIDQNVGVSVYQFSWYTWVIYQRQWGLDGETGLADSATVQYNNYWLFGSDLSNSTTMPDLATWDMWPADSSLTVTIFFPGEDHCGTIIPTYSKSYTVGPPKDDNPAPRFTGFYSSCSGYGTYLRADISNPFKGRITYVDPSPDYTVLQQYPEPPAMTYFSTATYYSGSSLVPGHTYRVILEDACGRKDSMDAVYNPGGGSMPSPTVTDAVGSYLSCSNNPADSLYYIIVNPLPAGYLFMRATLRNAPVNTGTFYGTMINGQYCMRSMLLPPGTYTYDVEWVNGCSTGIVTQTITITAGATPLYNRDLVLSTTTEAPTCTSGGTTSIKLSGFLRNVNTGYYIKKVRLAGAPSGVLPLKQNLPYSLSLDSLNATIGTYSYYGGSSYDSVYFDNSVIQLLPGSEGTYTFAMDIACMNGTVVETVTRTINVSNIPSYLPAVPDLKLASALICDGSANAKINLTPIGGRRSFFYEYKLSTDNDFTSTGNGGLDSLVTLSPVPQPGTLYDIRVTDACGNTAVSKVSTASFTGDFYISALAPDCVTNPFGATLRTSSVNGANYTWKRNGNTIAQGLNVNEVSAGGISTDLFTVEVNIYDCYNRSGSRTIVFDNNCNVTVLPVSLSRFTGKRINASAVETTWKTETETNMDKYIVEKSIDGSRFNAVGEVRANNLPGTNNYKFTDTKAIEPVAYYRLNMIEKSGHKRYSQVLRFSGDNTLVQLQVYPSPAQNTVNLYLPNAQPGDYTASVYNDKGQLIQAVKTNADEVRSGKTLVVNGWAAGLYFVKLNRGNETIGSTRFFKQ